MLREDLLKTAYGPFCFNLKKCAVGAFKGKFAREM